MMASKPSEVLIPPHLYLPIVRRLQQKACRYYAAHLQAAAHIEASASEESLFVWFYTAGTGIVLFVVLQCFRYAKRPTDLDEKPTEDFRVKCRLPDLSTRRRRTALAVL